jgi:tRNA(Ile)-lysidine synthase
LSAGLQAHVRAFLKPRLTPGMRLCVGYSGGLDSSVLLHVLAGLRAELGVELSAVHVHHGLSDQADDWAEHCRLACDRLQVPLTVSQVEVESGGHGLEAAARAARYRSFAEQMADVIVLAHHRDDQAETLLFRLLRGAGVHGLSAMADATGLAGKTVLRPLLYLARTRLHEYAREHAIGFVDDESNADTALARNWLRHDVFPVLDQRFPASRAVLARTAGQLAESAGLLDDLAQIDLAAALTEAGLSLEALTTLGASRARNVLRYWLREQTGAGPSRAWLEEALSQLTEADPDRHPALPLVGRVLRRQAGCAVLTAASTYAPAGNWRWSGEPELSLGEVGSLRFTMTVGAGLAADHAPDDGAVVVWRTGGELIQPDCRRPVRTLKNLLREAGVPARARALTPLLLIDGRVVWAAGFGVDCAAQAGPGEPGWLIEWCPLSR